MLEFQLHQLGWFSFEQLCRTVGRECWNVPIESYSRGRDGGRDGFLFGPSDSGQTIIQCKHTSNPNTHLALSDLNAEQKKIARHVEEGRCHSYIVMTNARVTGETAEAIEGAFRELGVKQVLVLGYEALCEMMAEKKILRTLVPRLYGLGDLSEILDERSYAQAESILAMMHDDLARLVPVEAHREAFRALQSHGFALLLGRPGSGKSSIAASLAIGAMDHYGARPVRLSKIDEIHDRWNPNEPDQFFWLDDGFGATQYEYSAATAWNRSTSVIAAALKSGARFIVTSRDYIYSAARNDLKQGAFPLLEESTVVIQVESFTREEREQILYNHLHLGSQPSDVLMRMKSDDLEAVAAHASFLPELARRLANPVFTRGIRYWWKKSIVDFFERPVKFLLEVLLNLDEPSRAALGLIHLRGNRLPSPYVLSDGDDQFLSRVGVTLGEALRALPVLEGSLVRLVSVGNDRWWQFQHPTLTGAYQVWLAEQPELLAQYVASAELGDMLRTITCGNVGVEGAVVVPSALYQLVCESIRKARAVSRPIGWYMHAGEWRKSVCEFLHRRSDVEFVRLFITNEPDFIDEVFEGDVSTETTFARIAKLLLDEGLASEWHRRMLVERLTEYAVEGIDGSFLMDEAWMALFSESEIYELDAKVLDELDQLAGRIDHYLGESEGDVDTADASLSGYERRYPDHPYVVTAREHLNRYADPDPPESTGSDYGDVPEGRRLAEVLHPPRSIFDDVAEREYVEAGESE